MKKYTLSKLQEELRSRGIPELAKQLKDSTGYDPIVRKLHQNPREIEVAGGAHRIR